MAHGAHGDDHRNASKDSHGPMTAEQRFKLLKGAAGIYFFFIQYGKLQEGIFHFTSPKGEVFNAVWFLQFLDALAGALVGAAGRRAFGSTPGMPQAYLATGGLAQVTSKYCLSASLAAGLSFPVATLAKSAKMIPVMVGSLLFGGQRFSNRALLQAAAIVGGTSLVTLTEGKGKRGGNSAIGLAFVLAALACDGVVGGLQKRLKKKLRQEKKEEHPYDNMFWANFYMAVAAFGFAAARGELRQGWRFCRENPAILRQILKFGACGALGQVCIFYVIANFDSVTCTSITTTRKLMSVLLSLSDKARLPPTGWVGLSLAGAGILSEVL